MPRQDGLLIRVKRFLCAASARWAEGRGVSDDQDDRRYEAVMDNPLLGNLPEGKRRELALAAEIIRDGYAEKLKFSTAEKRRTGKVVMILLFGSYARDEWVDDPDGQYFSDFDILVVVNNELLTEDEFTLPIDDRLRHEKRIRTDVSCIFHTLEEVNNYLREGRYFFTDIYNEHIPLWELPETKTGGGRKHRLRTPGKPEPIPAYEIAQDHYSLWKQRAEERLFHAKTGVEKGWYNSAAFDLHQAAEFSYGLFLLVRTSYIRKNHKLTVLSSLAAEHDKRFQDIWPMVKPFKGYFRKLDEAYVLARYSSKYEVTKEQIAWMLERVEALYKLATTAARDHLEVLKAEADKARADKDGDSQR